MTTATENAYELLGVSPTATAVEIRRAWLAAIKQIHPDHARDERERVQLDELARELNAAYHELKDPERRAVVDAALRDQRFAASQSAANQPPTWATAPASTTGSEEELDRLWDKLQHQHHHRDALLTRGGFIAFFVQDRLGQWLATAIWLGMLLWVVTPALRLNGATWLVLTVVWLGLQAVAAHRFKHTPAHDLARLSRTVALGFGRLLIETFRAASRD